MSDMINVSQCTNLTDRRMLHQYIIKELSNDHGNYHDISDESVQEKWVKTRR